MEDIICVADVVINLNIFHKNMSNKDMKTRTREVSPVICKQMFIF